MANKKVRKQNTRKTTKRPSWKMIGIGLVALLLATAFVIASDQQAKVEHDLSAIGNGKVTVVQVHDPGCQQCQRLKRVVGNVKGDFGDDVQFRTANIKTEKGRQFAQRYNVPHVTLVFFDKHGKHANTLQGVSSSQDVSTAIKALLER